MNQYKNYVMDETDAPYDEADRPVPRTLNDDLFLLKIVEEKGLELRENSYLSEINEHVM